MIRKIKNVITFTLLPAGVALVLTGSALALFAPAAFAATPTSPAGGNNASGGGTFQQAACDGVNQVGDSGCSSANSTISNLFASVLNILSLIAGFAGVVMIIISGFKFVTAQGDSSAIASARQSLIYALIGLVIAFLAQLIVHFVLGKVTGIS